MGTSQSKEKCGCFGSPKGRYNKEHRIRSCVTEVTMENMDREINRVKARQRIARQKGYLKYKGSKIQKTSDIPSQQTWQHYSNQQDHPQALSSGTSSLGNVGTVGCIFSRLIGVAEVNQAEVNEVSSHGSSVEKIEKISKVVKDDDITVDEVKSPVNGEKAKAEDVAENESVELTETDAVAEILDEVLAKSVEIAEREKSAAVAEILDKAVSKAVDIAEQEKAAAVAEILDKAVSKAVDIVEQEKAAAVAEIFDEAVSKAVDIAEQEKTAAVAEILEEAVSKSVDIAEQEKAAVVQMILDEAVFKAVDIAEREKAAVVQMILDEAVFKAVDIAEQEKAAVVEMILDEAVAKAVDIAEQEEAAVVAQILDEADECRPLDPVPSLCTTVVAHEELLKSAEQEDEVSVKAEPLMVPSMSRKGSWVRDSSRQTSAVSKQRDVIRTESRTSLYKPCQLKEAFKQTKTLEGIRNLQQKVSMSPFKDPLRKELYSDKFTILDSQDNCGCAIAVYVAQGHSPATSHEVVMNNIYIQLNQAVKSPQTQANGIILLYDFSKADYKASDLQLFAKILQVFKTAYPVPLKRTLLISAPFWLEAELQLLGLRVRRQDRIEMVTRSKLKECLPVTCLPEDLGGNNLDDHVQWIEQCLAGYVETFGTDDGQNGWTNDSAPLGDFEFEVKSDVEEKQECPSAPPAVIWQVYPKKSGHGSLKDTQSGLKSITKRKVQENLERRSAQQNLIWQTSPEKSGQASLRAVPSELKSESRRKGEETKGRPSASGNLIWQLSPLQNQLQI